MRALDNSTQWAITAVAVVGMFGAFIYVGVTRTGGALTPPQRTSVQTQQNLSTAMHGEAFAFAKYMLYAEHARHNGHAELAALFEDTARTERFEHFAEEAQLAGLVGSEEANLRDAIKGESYEVETMYKEFAEQALAAEIKQPSTASRRSGSVQERTKRSRPESKRAGRRRVEVGRRRLYGRSPTGKEVTAMKILKRTPEAHATPVTRPFKPDAFFERMKEFEDAMMRRAYELFAPAFYSPATEWENLFRDEFASAPVPIEVTETEEELVVHAEVPGFKEKEIEVRVEPYRVFIGGKREQATEEKKGKTVYSERSYNQIARWVELPSGIVPDKVKATLNKGLLEITLQKAQPAKKVPIEMKAA